MKTVLGVGGGGGGGGGGQGRGGAVREGADEAEAPFGEKGGGASGMTPSSAP